MSGVLYIAMVLTVLGGGLIAGAFFAFSSFIVPALKRLPAAQGIATMQSMNVLALTPVFMMALFGTSGACLGLVGWAAISWGALAAFLASERAGAITGTFADVTSGTFRAI